MYINLFVCKFTAICVDIVDKFIKNYVQYLYKWSNPLTMADGFCDNVYAFDNTILTGSCMYYKLEACVGVAYIDTHQYMPLHYNYVFYGVWVHVGLRVWNHMISLVLFFLGSYCEIASMSHILLLVIHMIVDLIYLLYPR